MASLTPAEKKLDRVFSLYVRHSAAGKRGYCKCVTCGKLAPPEDMHAGHYVDRTYKCTRWDERNVHPQCVSCNTYHEGQKDEYALFLTEKYGAKVLTELNIAKHQICKYPDFLIKEMIREYTAKLKALKK